MSTGSLAFQFTPDASRLVLSTGLSSYILVVNLTGDKPSVLRRFDHHRLQNSIVHDRVIKGRSATVVASDSQLKPKANGHAAVNGNGDVDMSDINYPSPPPEDEDKMDEDDDSSSDEEGSSLPAVVSVERIAISMDGQWAATSDSRGRTHIFNLDSISVSRLLLKYIDHEITPFPLASSYPPNIPLTRPMPRLRPDSPLCPPPRLPRQLRPDLRCRNTAIPRLGQRTRRFASPEIHAYSRSRSGS